MMSLHATTPSTLPGRLATFSGFWDDHDATARQLAALGHVYDRPPLEALDEGSRCQTCSHFVARADSIRALEGPFQPNYAANFSGFTFHHPSCTRLQIRIPLDPQAVFPGLHGGGGTRRRAWRQSSPSPPTPPDPLPHQTRSGIFTLPPELRLEIYTYVLPPPPPTSQSTTTKIVQRNRDSARLTTPDTPDPHPGRLTRTALALLQTSRKIHTEALPLLYPTNTTFTFASTKTLYLFLRSIGPCARSLLSRLDIHLGSREDALALSLLATCARVRSLTLRLPRVELLPRGAPVWVVDGTVALLALRGVEEVRFAGREGGGCEGYMQEEMSEARTVRAEVTRAPGEKGRVWWMDGCLEI